MMGQQVKKTDAKFPAGIRVLVVDDDQTCLLWIENLLHTCQFKATTTLYAREAIEMLRRDKNKYDLVITDVQMPDIDGFQLLETIGLEMDLPVIMMSIYNDKKFVKKGVEHGAVDYLLKPVRLEEIQNIWQHVLRRRNKEKKTANPEKNGVGSTSCRRRRNSADYEDDDDDSGREKEEHTSHKRPRVIWTPELHMKFVAAVNHLGIDKAVPKKILDIMDVEILTRENVASHLQKYRMYLKKVNSQQNILERNSLEAMNYLASTHPNSLLSGYPPSLTGILGGRLNNSISSSDLIQSGQNLRNSISPHAKLQPNGVVSNLFQGMVGGIEQDQTQAGRILGHRGDYNSVLGVSENFVDPKVMMNGSKFLQTGHSPDCWKSAAQNNPQSSFQLAGTFTQNQHQMNNNVFESLMATSGGGGMLGAVGMDQNNLVANGEDLIHGTKPQQIISKRSDRFIPEEEFIPSNVESMDDIVNFMTRRENNGSTSMFIDGEFNFDAYGPASAL